MQSPPAAPPAIRRAIPPAQGKHYATITDPKRIGELLRLIESYEGNFVTRCALKLAPLLFVRPGELRRAEWREVNIEAAEWRIPAAVHIVPLSTQAVAILHELHPLTGRGTYLFPGEYHRDRPMSENTLNAALRRLGFGKDDITGHGFRSMPSSFSCTCMQ